MGEKEFQKTIVEMIRRAETTLPKDVTSSLKSCATKERNKIAKLQLENLLKNIELAKKMKAPICQDTGTFTFFIKLGGKVDFDIGETIRKAVDEATRKIPLRVNAVDPITRKPLDAKSSLMRHTIHFELAEKPGIEINLLVKGAGSENYSRLFMFKPTAGAEALYQSLISTITEAGGKICPPVTVGIGAGGNAEVAVMLAKKALLRPLNEKNPDKTLARLEKQLEDAANSLGIGPMGLGGDCTVLRVVIEKAASHTASLPVAVAFQCWPARRAKARLVGGKLKVVEQ